MPGLLAQAGDHLAEALRLDRVGLEERLGADQELDPVEDLTDLRLARKERLAVRLDGISLLGADRPVERGNRRIARADLLRQLGHAWEGVRA